MIVIRPKPDWLLRCAALGIAALLSAILFETCRLDPVVATCNEVLHTYQLMDSAGVAIKTVILITEPVKQPMPRRHP